MQALIKNNPFRKIVWPLAVAEIVVWASMFYSFPALLLEWERDLGWSKTELSGAFTLALAVSALLAPLSGRLIDRGWGRYVLTGSALLGSLALLVMSTISMLWQFYLSWICIGVAMAGCLYEPCFAFLTRVMGTRSRQAITLVALIAGFAGTISFPSTHALLNVTDWRGTVVFLAIAVLVVSVPMFWLGSGTKPDEDDDNINTPSPRTAQVLGVMRRATFWFLAAAYATVGLGAGLILTHLLPMLDERGVNPDTAVLAASMIGPMQVAGRLAMMAAERHVSTLLIAAACNVAMAIAAATLLGAGFIPVLLVTFVIFHGAGYGVTSIIRPVVTAELLGRRNFGAVAGLLAVPYLAASAASPTVAAVLWVVGGYNLVIWVAIASSAISLVCLLSAARLANARQAEI